MADVEKTLDEQKKIALFQGVASIMDSPEFKTYCNSMNKLMYNNYSARNCNEILNQWIERYCESNKIDFLKLNKDEVPTVIAKALKDENAPTYLMGYEAWKQYGRQVTGKGVGYSIVSPLYVTENAKGNLLKHMKDSMKKQFDKDSNLEYATYTIGASGLSFRGYKNGLYDIVLKNNTVKGKLPEETVRKFLDKEVLNKEIKGYTTVFVYDVKNTVVPEYLWVKNGFTDSERELDINGEPITRFPYKNSNAREFKIRNTEERKSRFNPHLSFDIKELDEEKMNTLFGILQKISEKKGVPMTVEPIEEDGVKGFFSHADNRIVIKEGLSPTEKCSVAFHEMAHADMHYKKSDLTRELKEVQAEAVAYMTAQNFGIETDTKSFQYISLYSKGRDLKALDTSLTEILNQSKKLTKEITRELEKNNLNINLEEIPFVHIPEKREAFIKEYKQIHLESMDLVNAMKSDIREALDDSLDERCSNILKEQSGICNQIIAKCNESEKLLGVIESYKDKHLAYESANKVESNYRSIQSLRLQFSDLTDEYTTHSIEVRAHEKKQFLDLYKMSPKEFIKDYINKSDNKDYKSLSENQIRYITNSKYISANFNKYINTDREFFMRNAFAQAKNIEKVQSKDGIFIEIPYCEKWTEDKLFEKGTLVHPKTANKMIEAFESSIRELKAEAEKKGDYYPYSKCRLSMYIPTEDDKLIVTSLRIDIGDGYQKNLSDFIERECSSQYVKDMYFKAVKENVKDKIIEPASADRKLSIEELKERIENDKEDESPHREEKKKTAAKRKVKEKDKDM